MSRLGGRVVVVSVDAAETATTLANEGAAVVVVGPADAAGRVVADVSTAGGRAALFAGDLDREDDRAALAEMLDELFGHGDTQ